MIVFSLQKISASRRPNGSVQGAKSKDMKRILSSIFAIILAASTVLAQEWRDENRWHDPFDIYAGPKVGVTASNLTQYDGKYLFSPYIGGFIQTYFNNHFGMSFEMGYTRIGAHDAWDNFHSDAEISREDGTIDRRGPYEYRFDYLETLYKMRYYPVRNFNVMAGFLFGVHINAKSELDNEDYDILDHVHKRSAHALFGVGYEKDKISIEAIYGFPLSKLASTDTGKRALGDAKINLFMVTVGYHIKVY